MGAHIVDANCSIECPHGGQGTVTSANTQVKVGGGLAVLATDTVTISGCSFTTPAGNPLPCLTIQWSLPANQDTVNGTPVLLETSVGLCLNAAQAPQGMAKLSSLQTKVSGA